MSFLFGGTAGVSRQIADNLYYPFMKSDALTANQQNLNAWSYANPNSNFPVNRVSNTDNNTGAGAGYINSLTYRDADYLRLKNIELSYSLKSKKFLTTLGLSKLKVYISGKDLWTISKLDDRFDPEPETVRTYPLMKFYNMGLEIAF
jgi:hypothetical protein